MTDWLSQYTAALTARDCRESAHRYYIEAYCKLADRTAALESSSATSAATPSDSVPTNRRQSTPEQRNSNRDALLSSLRTDLSTAQRERAELHSRLSRLEAQVKESIIRAQTSERRTAIVEREKRDAERKLRDRDEEIRGKNRLVTEAHDEMVGLNLQLNMAEERAAKLKTENEELVRRWMERMGREADQMNSDSKWT